MHTRAQAHTYANNYIHLYKNNCKHKNRKRLDLRTEKDISGYTMEELAQIVLKNKMFTFNLKIYRQNRSTAIGTKFVPA